MSEEGTTSRILSRAEWLAQRRRQCPRRKKMTVRSATSKRRTDVQETLHLRHRLENVNVSKVVVPADSQRSHPLFLPLHLPRPQTRIHRSAPVPEMDGVTALEGKPAARVAPPTTIPSLPLPNTPNPLRRKALSDLREGFTIDRRGRWADSHKVWSWEIDPSRPRVSITRFRREQRPLQHRKMRARYVRPTLLNQTTDSNLERRARRDSRRLQSA